MMTEAEFLTCYRQTLVKLENILEEAVQSDLDIDYESSNDMLSLLFSNDSVAIISRQTAIRQLWLAARSGGFHFEFDVNKKSWICTVNDRSLQVMLMEICVEQGSIQLDF